MKILTIIGARPQFIKAASLSRYLKSLSGIKEIILHTGQHYDSNMSEEFFSELDIPTPDYNLQVGSDTPARQTAKMMMGIEDIVLKEWPDFILIYGDTNSTIAGALVGAKLHIPIAHVEAGLRSYDRGMPEEINRVVSDSISTLLFCPTETAVNNLKKEGIATGVYNVGDIMLENYQYYKGKAQKTSTILNNLNLKFKKYILCTIHRASNTDNTENLKNIFIGLTNSKETIILPLHPRTKKKIDQNEFLKKYIDQNIKIIDPIGYFDMICLEINAKKIVTDSGGVQKEAYFNKVPCITLRENTEWVETIEQGVNQLVGVDPKKIKESINNFHPQKQNYSKQLYGDGKTSAKIIEILLSN
ncbi:UDP-N-acetylglucosamine 2-epimerase (non-hydrolyzing) [Candidatus Atribacteria bacterium HGW-Atribacteria-1]|nr:MAG: UDP-N-acetylglucosamine 2-epimerase (non-hydrolyzing) [Candidatus Atribacteria bacterium HGW-Atribacteria-1]